MIEALDITYTFDMKKVESAVLNILYGRSITNRYAFINPGSLDFYEKFFLNFKKNNAL